MNTFTASEARANLYRLIDQAAESHEPIVISGKRSSAVLLSAEDWSAIQETLPFQFGANPVQAIPHQDSCFNPKGLGYLLNHAI